MKTDVFGGHPPEVKIRTKKMMMWLVIFAIVMLFAGFTSAYIVATAGSYWVHVNPPAMLWVSLAVITASSVTIYMALRSIRSGNSRAGSLLVLVTFALGIGFTITQTMGWRALQGLGMGYTVSQTMEGETHRWNAISEITGEYGKDYYITLNNEVLVKDGDRYYLPGDTAKAKPVNDKLAVSNAASSFVFILIFVHILHLVLGLVYLLVLSRRALQGILGPENWISLYTGGMYWHFLGLLWIYLFFFLFYLH